MNVAEARSQELHEVTEETATNTPVFTPSVGLAEMSANVKRLRRNIEQASSFNPRARRRLAIAEQATALRWAAEVEKFERANPDTGTNGGES